MPINLVFVHLVPHKCLIFKLLLNIALIKYSVVCTNMLTLDKDFTYLLYQSDLLFGPPNRFLEKYDNSFLLNTVFICIYMSPSNM